MKKLIIALFATSVLLSSCTTYTGTGAYVGAGFGSVLGSALGGIVGGPMGRDVGTVMGMASGAAVGAAVGATADQAEMNRRERAYRSRRTDSNTAREHYRQKFGNTTTTTTTTTTEERPGFHFSPVDESNSGDDTFEMK